MEKNKVNLYFVPNPKNERGGQFYNLYVNRGERLDLRPFLESVGKDVDKLTDTVKKEDETFKPAGGMILKRDDEFESVDVYSPNQEGINISPEQQTTYTTLLDLVKMSNEQAQALIETQQRIQALIESLGLSQEKRRGK